MRQRSDLSIEVQLRGEAEEGKDIKEPGGKISASGSYFIKEPPCKRVWSLLECCLPLSQFISVRALGIKVSTPAWEFLPELISDQMNIDALNEGEGSFDSRAHFMGRWVFKCKEEEAPVNIRVQVPRMKCTEKQSGCTRTTTEAPSHC
ncbi:hypothetical protein HNY73_013651 [Argiope bruennichi]|uniref:Uncharacterized protein n=1 Tax=Argiope bruennichi TaxID=94029 RepID=A0A8T0EYV1_ARGBR|nr:hypothetical protein HNY73_013651 [Argiope bruennichi]